MEAIKKVTGGNCEIRNIATQLLRRDKIILRTVRTQGQYRMQRFFYILDGKAKFEQNDKTILCQKGDILYLPPDVTYICTWELGKEDHAAVLVQFDLLADGNEVTLTQELSVIYGDMKGKYAELFLRLAKTYTEGSFGYKLKCQAIALELLHGLLSESVKARQIPHSDAVYRGIWYIEEHYRDTIDVNALAKSCSMCPSAFRSKFHTLTGMSPIAYKNHLAMEKSAELLRTGLYTVAEVAQAVGMEDVCYFSRLFRQHHAVPPGKYKSRFF